MGGEAEAFQPQREGAFLAYLRTALLSAIRSEIRRSLGHGKPVDVDLADTAAANSTLAQHAGADLLIDYERALTALSPEWREAVILRVEFGFSYDEMAAAMERPSANPAPILDPATAVATHPARRACAGLDPGMTEARQMSSPV